MQQLAPEALTAAVEDTVRRIGELDETTFENPALLEAAVTEAFHEAAAENFPPQLLIPELHEATVTGTWVSMPLGGRRKYYKKYTRVFDVEITPQIAAALKTSGGATIGAFLKDHLRVSTRSRPGCTSTSRRSARRFTGSRASRRACQGSGQACGTPDGSSTR